ncbi:hypothetical protein ARMGADRAFT_1047408 [Armillaria gallica]|uniref:Ndc10 domain-containing protein n=1 Tax=Armillaria gallica TaxID=47427 RepID=A0A2H3D3H9_ARMGA|nr:hypothetical protein ARMGADRAFT_1047408 [Armillaria gallica]
MYSTHFTWKDPLQQECDCLGLAYAKSANLAKLQSLLANYWYHLPTSDDASASPNIRFHLPPDNSDSDPDFLYGMGVGDNSEVELLHDYMISSDRFAAEEILGYNVDNEGEEDDTVNEAGDNDEDLDDDEVYELFQKKTHTQASCVQSLNEFLDIKLAEGQIRDCIIDVHCLLLFITWLAEWQKRNCKNEPIAGTLLGASQIKKLFFAALQDPSLTKRRPATNVLVYDAIKDRMDAALMHSHSGIDSNEDAVDIVANTFLAVRIAVFRHLAWTCQMASRNHSDDFQSLRLVELQPYVWLHPNKQTQVFSVLGMQGEKKANRRGMQIKINPVYSVFIVHHDAMSCPLGAMIFYFHYIHDYFEINKKMIFHSQKLPSIPYSDSSLHNIYNNAFDKADFSSKAKVHLPCHLLGYQQEKMGIDSNETAKLGWSHGTYFDTYAPALAKTAVLRCHGYKAHEEYNPVWCHVDVPSEFLKYVCPMAENIWDSIIGRDYCILLLLF